MSSIALVIADKSIIAWQRSPWTTPGEYVNPIFYNVIFECPDDMELVSIDELGPMTSKAFATAEGEVICPHVFEDATVILRETQGGRIWLP